MIEKWKESTTIKDLSKFKLEELIPECLWVAYKEDGALEFAFYEFMSHVVGSPKENIEVELLMHGYGFSEGLRECRHTYWGDKGYIFYPNAERIRAILTWLEQYFDME